MTHRWDKQSQRPRSQCIGELSLNYDYDAAGRIQKMQVGDFSPLLMQYDGAGRERLRHSAAGFIQAQSYSPTGMLVEQAAGRDSAQFRHLLGGEGMTGSAVNRRWAYDRAYNVLSIEDGLWGHSRFSYDQNDQITRAEMGGMLPLEEHFGYDANLNIREHSRIPRGVMSSLEQVMQHQQSGRVVQRNGSVYLYDAAGRLKEKRVQKPGWLQQTWRYRWNADNQLSELRMPDGRRWRYAYDPFGRRIRKQIIGDAGSPATTRPTGCEYFWSGDQMISETPLHADGTAAYDDSIHWLYLPGGLTPTARYENSKLHYVVCDHMGTPRELLTEQGNAVWAGRMSVWGQSRQWPLAANDDSKLRCNVRFAGQYEDEESGLHYNRFRYYDNESGQYLTPDPIGLAGGVNPYGYVHNPLGWVDPLGLACCPPKTGADVTENMIKRALEGDSMQTVQGSVSLPAIQRYVERLLQGDVAPQIKIDGNIVVEGNHRYIAGKVAGIMPEMAPGTLSPSQSPNIKPMSSTTVDDFDWGNY